MSDKSIREILCENCKMNCKLLANNALVFGCFFNHNTNEDLQKAFESYESQYKAEIEELKKENESLKKKLEKTEEIIKKAAPIIKESIWVNHQEEDHLYEFKKEFLKLTEKQEPI